MLQKDVVGANRRCERLGSERIILFQVYALNAKFLGFVSGVGNLKPCRGVHQFIKHIIINLHLYFVYVSR